MATPDEVRITVEYQGTLYTATGVIADLVINRDVVGTLPDGHPAMGEKRLTLVVDKARIVTSIASRAIPTPGLIEGGPDVRVE